MKVCRFAMVEAMLSGRPVIATDVGGCLRVDPAPHGENGFLIPAATPASRGRRRLEEAWAER